MSKSESEIDTKDESLEEERFVSPRKVGRFYISSELVESIMAPVLLEKMGFVPTRVEFLFFEKVFEYIGMSLFFDEVPFGEKIPLYEITIKEVLATGIHKEVGENVEVLVTRIHDGSKGLISSRGVEYIKE